METATIQAKPAARTPFAPAKPEQRISWEEFQRKYLTREDEYTYEWLDGVVEKTKRTRGTGHNSSFFATYRHSFAS